MQVDASTGVDRSGTPFTLLCTYVLAGLGFGCMVGWGLVGVFSPSLSLLSYEGITQSLVLRSIGIAAIAITYALCKAQADWVLELSPGSGRRGGELVFAGTPAQLAEEKTATGLCLGEALL